MLRHFTLLFTTSCLTTCTACFLLAGENEKPAPEKWPEAMKTIRYRSPADDSMQPAVVYVPKKETPVPLLVALHTWSHDYRQYTAHRAEWCIKNDWAMIAPDFRGVNEKPEACGSEFVVADIVAAVEFMKRRTRIDTDRIYLVGRSGGGYASLLLAGRHPEIWAGVSAWVPISDLKIWYAETSAKKRPYPAQLRKCCGGAPGDSPEADEQYRRRSAITWLPGAANVPLDISHGIADEIVPVSQSIRAFNLLAAPEHRLGDEQMRYFHDKRKVPEQLRAETQVDPLFGENRVLFRRVSGNCRLTIFQGGHQAVEAAAMHWLSLQRKGRKADWTVSESPPDRPTQADDVGR